MSRANLIQALAAFLNKVLPPQPVDDTALRERIVAKLKSEPWAKPSFVNVTVTDGAVDLWGIVDSPAEKQALRVAVQVTPGVKAVNDNVIVRPALHPEAGRAMACAVGQKRDHLALVIQGKFSSNSGERLRGG